MRRFLAFTFLASTFLLGCQRELLDPADLQVTLAPGYVFPLAHVYLDLGDVLPVDSAGPATLTDEPFYILAYEEDSLFEISVEDLLEIPAQAPVSLNAPLGLLSLPDFQSSASVSLGTLSANITNPSTFGSSMASAHGSNAPFPPLPTQNPGALSSINLGTIQSADFATGSMVMQFKNGFPAPMSATIALADAQGMELLTFSYLNIAAGDSATDGQDLSGLTLPGTLNVVLKNVSSPGAGTPGIPSTYVPIDTTDALTLTLLGSGMKVRSATATMSTQTVIDSSFWMGFAAPTGVEITEIGMLSGQLDYSITSGFAEDVSITFGLPGSSVNGGPAWTQTITVLNNSNVFGAFSWAGLSMDLSQDSMQPFNQLPLAYEVTLLSSGQPVVVDSSQAIAFNFTINNLGMDYVYGFFGQDVIPLPSDTVAMSFPALDRLQGSIVFSEPALSLNISNESNIGIPITLDLNLASIRPNGSSVNLNNSPVVLNAPVDVTQLGQNSSANVDFYPGNSNIVDVLTWPKTGVAFGGEVAYNQDTTSTGRFNYISHTSGMKVGAQFTLPFALTASGLSFKDSVNVESLAAQLQSDSTLAISAEMSIHSISHFPVDAALHFRFYGPQGQVVWVEDVPLVHSATVDPVTGFVAQSTSATDVLTLDEMALDQISNAKWLEIEATLETAGGGQDPVKLQATNGLELHIGMQVEFEKDIL